MRQIAGYLVLLLLVCAFSSCAPLADSEFEMATSRGYTKEIDEPSTRGQLTRVTPNNMDIAWNYTISPDGQALIFSGRSVGSRDKYELYKLNMNSSTPIKLTAGGVFDASDPSFTSDGKFIVYRTGNEIWKIRADGAGAKMRIQGSGLSDRDYYPEVSRQDRLVFVTYEPYPVDKFMIWSVGLQGEDLTQYREGNHPTWSPDGERISFSYDGNIWMMNSNGTELTQLTDSEADEDLPAFSNDGQIITYASNDKGDGTAGTNIDVWYMNIDGTSKTRLTELKSWDSYPIWNDGSIYFASGRAKDKKPATRIWKIKIRQ
jgi:Tol biopolymer transport system component